MSLANQRLFFHHGVTTVEKLAAVARDRDDLVEMLKQHWGLDQANSLGERVQVASIVCAFTNATTRSQRSAEVEAEYGIQDKPKPLISGEWSSMRAALERRQGTIEDSVMPSKEFIEMKLAEIESAEYRAEALSEVVSKDEVDVDTLVPVFTSKGMSLRKGTSKVAEPSNAEEFRRRLSIMCNAMILVSLKHTNRAELQGEWVKTFDQYKDYILGEFVYGLRAKDSDGNVISSPPWNLILAYDHAVRKRAARLVNQEGKVYTVALKEAWRDTTVKERYFITPLALYAKRPAPPKWAEPVPRSTFQRTNPKPPKGRGKAGGRSMSAAAGGGVCASHTPEGDMVCYRFNTAGEKCKSKKCKYRHVCGICFSDKHPMYQCSTRTRQDVPPDTQGSK